MRIPFSILFATLFLMLALSPASLRADDEESAEPMNPQSLLNNLLKNQEENSELHDEESHNTAPVAEPPARGQRSRDLGDIIRVDGRGVRMMAIDQGDVVRVDATRGGYHPGGDESVIRPGKRLGVTKECGGVVSVGRGSCHPNFER